MVWAAVFTGAAVGFAIGAALWAFYVYLLRLDAASLYFEWKRKYRRCVLGWTLFSLLVWTVGVLVGSQWLSLSTEARPISTWAMLWVGFVLGNGLFWLWVSPRAVATTLSDWPGVSPMLLRAVWSALTKPRTLPNHITQLPALSVCDVSFSSFLTDLFRMIMEDLNGTSPDSMLMYFIAESIRLCLFLLTHPRFPVAAIGAVLSKHTSELKQPHSSTQPIQYRCAVVPEVRRTPTGNAEIDLISHATTEDGSVVWESCTTVTLLNLSRKRSSTASAPPLHNQGEGEICGEYDLAKNTGRRYGALTGDLNPIHLWPWSAKLFGFRKPIAHALYLMALIDNTLDALASKPRYPRKMSAEFKRPTLLPAKLNLIREASAGQRSAEEGIGFQLMTRNEGKEPPVELEMYRTRSGQTPTYYNSAATGSGLYGTSTSAGLYGNSHKAIGRNKEDRTLSVTFARGDGDQHCSGVQALMVQNGHLYSASRDSTIKRWALREDHAPVFRCSLEGHCDWVNDLTFVEKYLASASSDGTVRLWNPERKTSSAPGYPILTSAGLRSEIYFYDLEHDARSTRRLFPPEDSSDKGSVYSLVMDGDARIIAAGSTDAVIRLFDIREATKIMKLKGHTENVRCLAMNADGTRLLSGSSDHSIKLWDLRHQRCVQTFHVHSDSVWSILAGDSFDVVISGGRDKCVFKTNLAHRTSELLFAEEEPIQHIVRGVTENSLWVATASSSIRKWKLPTSISGDYNMWGSMESTSRAVPGRAFLVAGTSSRRSSETVMNLAPLQSRPSQVIAGLPAIVEDVVLNDRCRILTRDSENNVSLWDVTTGCEIEQYGHVDFKERTEELHQFVSVPRWFSTDKRLGQLTVVFKFSQCFDAEFYAADLGIDAPEDKRLNYGECMLKGLFGRWAMDCGVKNRDDTDPVDVWGPGWIDRKKKKVPSFRFWDDPRARVFVSSVKKSTEPWKLGISDIHGHACDTGELAEWITDCVLRSRIPIIREWKCSFHLTPYDDTVPQISQSRLNAPRILQVRKVATYLKQKLADLDPPFPVHVIPFDADPSESQADSEDTSSIPDEMDLDATEVELMCNGKAVPFWMSLSAVHEYLWKSSQDLQFQYRVRTGTPAPMPQLAPQKN